MTETPEQYQDAAKFLKDFSAAMCEWQQKAHRLLKEVKHGKLTHANMTETMHADLKPIFKTYVRRKAMPKGLVFGLSYDPSTELILDIEGQDRKVIITVQQTTAKPNRKLRYTLDKTVDGYKIMPNRMYYNEFEKKYLPWDLLF